MNGEEREAAIGRAVGRMIDAALQDDVLRPALEAFALTVLERLGQHPVPDLLAEVAAAVAPLPEPVADALLAAEPGEVEAGPDADQAAAPAPEEPVAPARRAPVESVPMDRSAFLALVEGAIRDIQADARGTMVEALLGEDEAGALAAIAPRRALEVDATDLDAPLAGIMTRARLRAAVARDVAERARSGRPLVDDHVHRARSEGAATWMLDLLDPDPDRMTAFAECLDAVADCAEMVILLRRYEGGDRLRRAEAVKDLAAVQSALRIATISLRQSPDEEQLAAFTWAAAVSKAERIYIDRHMRLDDALDPGQLAEIMEPVHRGLSSLKERSAKDEALRKRFQQVTYLTRQLKEGKAAPRDLDKLVEAIDALVCGGLPASSLKLRDLLLPVASRLPLPENRPPAYGRVIAELDRHLERDGRRQAEAALDDANDDTDDDVIGAIASPSDAVAVARAHLSRVVIPDAAIAAIGEIDGTPASPAWGRQTWKALRALEAYAHNHAGSGSFWEWCEHGGHVFAWPASPRKLAMSESDTVQREYLEDRRFPVDKRVAADGTIVMLAHCKIAEGGGRLTPRLYFHDDTRGVTGSVHIGFIGPHHLVRNAGLAS